MSDEMQMRERTMRVEKAITSVYDREEDQSIWACAVFPLSAETKRGMHFSFFLSSDMR